MSMAWLAARKLRKIIDNVRRILAVEYVCAARAIELRAPLTPSPATGTLIALLRQDVGGAGPDRFLSPELVAAEALLDSPAMVASLEGIGVDIS